MISWMQKHNKYLVWTIWIATIAFIGAGFVGWGSYSFGGKAGNVAKVGNIEISQTKLNLYYSELYNQYNQAMQGKLDEKQAKELGIAKQAFSQLEMQAKILNFAQDAGIIVSDTELRDRLFSIKAFQKDNLFNKEIYQAYLASQRLKAKTFEANLREELIIKKTLSLLSTNALPLEEEAITAAMNVSDKVLYSVLTLADVNLTLDAEKVKTFWEERKSEFITPEKYDFSVVWTETEPTSVTEDEAKKYYEENRFNYTNAQGKQLAFAEAKTNVINDLKLKKTKKSAQKSYIAFKKGKITQSEALSLAVDDAKLTPSVWEEVKAKNIGDILKPKVIENKYAVLKIDHITLAKEKTFEEAKKEVEALYLLQAKKEALFTLAEEKLQSINKENATVSKFLKLDTIGELKPLNSQESLQFAQKLFTSSKEKGMISLIDKVVVYSILEQKLTTSDKNATATVNKLKQNTFESNLIKVLSEKYPTEKYIGGL
jgi:peptidyl-prolyl cis-trans isomerase D